MNFPSISQILNSKTVQLAIIIAVLSVLQGYVFLLPITPLQQMFVGLGIAVVVTILRFVTTSSLQDK